MGTFVLKLYGTQGNRPARHQPARILQQLRRLKATLIGSTVEGAGAAAVELYTFATTGLSPAKPKRCSPCFISSIAQQRERVVRLEAVAQLGIALAGRPLAHHAPKEESMSKQSKTRTLVLGRHGAEARKLFLLARRLVNGEGPPEELRMPNPLVTVVPNANQETLLRNAWGIAGIGVALEMHRRYPPVEAMVIAGYILLGTNWPERFKTLRLPASLEQAYAALEQHFADSDKAKSAALVTIPKQKALSTRRIPGLSPVTVADQRSAAPALPAPEQPRLTHQPTPSVEESPIDAPARRVR